MSVSPFPQSNLQHHYSPIRRPSSNMVRDTYTTKAATVSKRLSPPSIARPLEQPYIPNHPPILPMGPRPSTVANLPPRSRLRTKLGQNPTSLNRDSNGQFVTAFPTSNKDGDSEEEDSDEEDNSEEDEIDDSENKQSEEAGCRRYGAVPTAVAVCTIDIEMSDSTSAAAPLEAEMTLPKQPSEDSEASQTTRLSLPSLPSISDSGRFARGEPDHRRTPPANRFEEGTPMFANWDWNTGVASVPISTSLRAKAARTPSPPTEPRRKSVHDTARPQAQLRQAARQKYGPATPTHSRIIDTR